MLLCLSSLVSSSCSVGLVAKPEPLSWWDPSLRPRRGCQRKDPSLKLRRGLSENGPIPKAHGAGVGGWVSEKGCSAPGAHLPTALCSSSSPSDAPCPSWTS